MLEFINLFLQVVVRFCTAMFGIMGIAMAVVVIKLIIDFQKKEKEDKNENGDE